MRYLCVRYSIMFLFIIDYFDYLFVLLLNIIGSALTFSQGGRTKINKTVPSNTREIFIELKENNPTL